MATTRTTPADLVLAVLLVLQACFQAALALGAPWGAAAWGGGTDGALPGGLRAASAVAAVLWLLLALVVARRLLGPVGRRRVLLGLAVYVSVGVLLNLVSPSVLERALWTPFTLVVAALAWWCWRAARRARPGPGAAAA